MTDWLPFLLALGIFFASHSWPIRARARLTGRLGRRGYLLAYSALSLAALALVIVAAGRAPYVPLWPALRIAPLLVMPVALWLSLEGVLAPNPYSLGRPGTPPANGITRITRHPLLLAMALWAGAHLLANPDLAHAVLFGGFAAFAIAGMAALDRRKAKDPGAKAPDDTGWLRLRPVRPDPRALVGAAALTVILIALHQPVLGVSPLP